jgi:hypothetical protein
MTLMLGSQLGMDIAEKEIIEDCPISYKDYQ